MYVLTEQGYVLICQVEKKEKKCSFENALVEKSKSSPRNKNGLVEGLLLFSIQMFTFMDFSHYINNIRISQSRECHYRANTRVRRKNKSKTAVL